VEYRIVFGGDPQDVTITTSGTATLAAFDAWIEEVLTDPRYRPGMKVLVDHRQVDGSNFTADDVRALADANIRNDSRIGPSIVAKVMGEPYKYGLARMWQAYVEGRLALQTRVFYGIDEALEWLRDPQRSE
jgi:hypothetical protein